MKLQDLFETKKSQVIGCEIRMLEGWRSRLQAAVKKLGYDVDHQGYEDGSTVWAVVVKTPPKFNIKKFEDDLRDVLNFDGWMEVEPYKISVREAVAPVALSTY